MRAYSDYQMINLPWLKQIPSHWEIRRNKNIFTEMKEEVGERSSEYTLLSLTLKGIIPRDMEAGGKFPSDFGKYKIVKKGYMAFCLFDVDETPRTVGLSEYDGMLTGAYTIMQVANINSRYVLYYYLALDNGKQLKPLYKGLRKTINIDTFQSTKIPVPPREEQDQIVRFLDWKVSEINRLINIKRKEIAVLKEQLASYISKIILTGVSDKPSMKPCDIEWIGAIPDHWETLRCKYLFSERDERSVEGKETHLSMSQKYGLIPDNQLDERRMLSESYAGAKICYKNDLVLNRLKAHLGVFALAPQLGVISPDYTVLIPNIGRILPEFAEMVLKSQKCRRELRIRVRGVTEGFWRLYTDDFNTITIPVPPLEEQKKIIEAVSSYMDKMKQYESCLSKEIEVLHEFKTSLISDVVTGKIDVRGIEIPEYEYTAEEADSDSEAEAEELDEGKE